MLGFGHLFYSRKKKTMETEPQAPPPVKFPSMTRITFHLENNENTAKAVESIVAAVNKRSDLTANDHFIPARPLVVEMLATSPESPPFYHALPIGVGYEYVQVDAMMKGKKTAVDTTAFEQNTKNSGDKN